MTDLVMTLDTLVTMGDQHLSADVDDEVVMMLPERGFYYAAGETGSRILRLLDQPRTIGQLCEALQEQFDVEARTCQQDVIDFVRELAREGLVTVSPSD